MRTDGQRAVAVAIPMKDEAAHAAACLGALDRAAGRYGGPVTLVPFANNCSDGTLAVVRAVPLAHARLEWRAASLLPPHAHAGWSRRLALDAAAALLERPGDVLATTDGDTTVAGDWIVRTVAHLDAGWDVVAGRALTGRAERAALPARARWRLNLLTRYYLALDWLRAATDGREPWPRHWYEGGASLATTRAWYRRIGGAPTPPVAEDRALVASLTAAGARVRHAVDVRVTTSARLDGRAPGGMADTLARWVEQGEHEPIHETYRLEVALAGDPGGPDACLTFATLPAELARAQRRIRLSRTGVRRAG